MTAPNVLWISTHDINPHLGAYAGVYPGTEYARTPNLDRLAAEGMRFDNAFASAPICAPSRSAIMTGCYPTAIGTMHMRTKAVPPPEVRLFSEYFREAGYYVTNNSFTDFQVPTPVSAFDDCSDTAHWRNRPTPDTPFFATFHGLITHESQIYLDDDAFAARTSHVSEHDRHDPALAPLPPYYPDTEVFRRGWARYSDLITEMDHSVGALLAELEADGLADNTIVVFWSDHGLGMPRGKRWANDSGLHEPLIIRWPGKITPGSVNTDLVHLMDLAPTMMQLCGLTVPAHVHGVPVLAVDGSPVPEPNEYLFGGRDRQGEVEDMTRTVRDRRFRYLRHYHPDRSPMQHSDYPDHLWTWAELRSLVTQEAGQLARGERRSVLTPLQRQVVASSKPSEELYDIAADPHETCNLAAMPEYADDVARLRRALEEWQSSYGDLGFLAEDDLLEQWRPGGVWRVTAPPEVSTGPDGLVSARSDTDGAHVVWTADPPPGSDVTPKPTEADRMGSPPNAIGSPPADGRYWRLLCDATPPRDLRIWLKGCRLGYLDSDEVQLDRVAGSVTEI